jgi:O-methyltransferase involved in polyketide biosynthesis
VDKIRPSEGKETWLATLYGKALDAGKERSILGDHFAAEAVDRLDYDFAALKLPGGADITLPMRARLFDAWTRAFLDAHPACTVLHLGCGLDTRVLRLDPGPGVRWYDVDLPAVVALRRQLYPERPGYTTVAASVTDPAWLAEVPGDTPVIVVAEGLFMYVPEAEGVALLRRVVERFPSGEITFDAYTASMVGLVSRLATVRGAKVELVWGIDDPRDLERAVPGLTLAETHPFLTDPELVAHLSTNAARGAFHRFFRRFAAYQNLVRHVRYTFGPTA